MYRPAHRSRARFARADRDLLGRCSLLSERDAAVRIGGGGSLGSWEFGGRRLGGSLRRTAGIGASVALLIGSWMAGDALFGEPGGGFIGLGVFFVAWCALSALVWLFGVFAAAPWWALAIVLLCVFAR